MLRRILIIGTILLLSASSASAKSQDIVKMNTDIEISPGMVANDVVAVGGNITVFGKVENNAIAVGGSVILKPNSSVAGQIVVVGGDLIKDPSATIAGRITQVYMPHFIPSIVTFLKGGWLVLWAAVSVLMLIGFIGLTVLLVALIPEHMGTAVNALERSFMAMFLWGILWTILIVPVAVLLAISIVGIILIPLEILFVVLALIIGYIASAAYIGKNILLTFHKISPPFIDAILGILVLFAVGFVPFVGSIIKVIFLVAGFGAVLTTRFGTIK